MTTITANDYKTIEQKVNQLIAIRDKNFSENNPEHALRFSAKINGIIFVLKTLGVNYDATFSSDDENGCDMVSFKITENV